MEDNFLIDEILEYKPATELYSLPPIGLGTAYVESLTSYIGRLAKAHCIKTGSLFSHILFPKLNKDYINNGSRGFFTSGHLINGTTFIAEEFESLLARLTGNPSMLNTTLLRFKNVLPTRGLLKSFKAWCPYCYEEMKADVVYEPLLWTFQSVNNCVKHLTPLEKNCPHCKKEALVIEGRSYSGYCPKCSEWLGLSKPTDIKGNDDEWSLYKARSIGEMLAFDVRNKWNGNIPDTLSKLVQTYSNTNVSEFAKYLGVPKSTFWGWYSGRNLPTLDDVIRICNKCDLNLMSFYLDKDMNYEMPLIISDERTKKHNKIITKRTIAEIKKELIKLTSQRETMSLGVSDISSKLQCNKKTIYKYFHKYCVHQSIMNRYYKTGRRSLRILKLNGEITSAFKELQDLDQAPTQRNVELKLNKPGALREKETKGYYKSIC